MGSEMCIRDRLMSKLTEATRSELESLRADYGWAQAVQQMRTRMLQDGNLPGGGELLRRLELMPAAQSYEVLVKERLEPQQGAGKQRETDW